jgi:copper resistance protein C
MRAVSLAAVAALLLSISVQAHTHLHVSVPANKAVVAKGPDALSLTFSGLSRLTSLTLQREGSSVEEIGPLPTAEEKEFVVPLGKSLPPGKYEIKWRIAGADSHVMAGSFSFTVAAGT